MRNDLKWMLRAAVAVVLLASIGAMSGCSKKAAGTDTDVVTDPNNPTNPTDGNPNQNPDATQNNPDDFPTDPDLEDIFFDYDDHTLSAEARSALSGNASHLKEMTSKRLTIEGHCDERGTTEYNLALGQRRADAARNYLVDLGIDGSRLATISYGEERPYDAGHDESAWSKNRRDHFRVTNP